MPLNPIQNFFRSRLNYGWVLAVALVGLENSSLALAAEQLRAWQATAARPFVLRGADRRLLDRAEQFIADKQWEDATAALLRLLGANNTAVVRVSDGYYVGLPEYCHRLLASFPDEPLDRYRRLVDATSESTYRRGIANRDQQALQSVVDQSFCSRWGDDALLALGELALERGDYQAARNAWSLISPQLADEEQSFAYPDTDLDLPSVAARLVLVSLREGNWERAERELEALRELSPDAKGRLAGREVHLVEHLSEMLKQAQRWPVTPSSSDWRTYAATAARTNANEMTAALGPYELLWSQPITNGQLTSFPIVVNGLVVYQDASSVHGLNLNDGSSEFTAKGSTFQSPQIVGGSLGQPHYSLTATDRFVFGFTAAVLGSQRRPISTGGQSTLWSLDLSRDGALALHISTDNPKHSFAGAPLVVGANVIVPIRANDQTARVGIAAYDQITGERNWLRWLCQANTPATGRTGELANNLLTYDSGTIYVNTNLGAIAAVRATDGRVLWLRTYQRQIREHRTTKAYAYYRSASPCAYHRGAVYVLPTDAQVLLTLDARTGRELWRYRLSNASAQLVGVTDHRVAILNEGLQVIERQTGKPVGRTPPIALTGKAAIRLRVKHGEIHWPSSSARGLVHSYNLSDVDIGFDGFSLPESGGANLLLANEYLVAAGPSRLTIFRIKSPISDPSTETTTSSNE